MADRRIPIRLSRETDDHVKKRIMEEGETEDDLQWMPFPFGNELYLLSDGTRP